MNQIDKNISTIEDPIEIHLTGINQINVNYKIGFDFVNALRALLRQDPDILMIGEIRDQETASMAIRAAQTGHLVLATLHTNSAIDTINRLIQIGISRLNLANVVNLIIAQRLIRKLCRYCKIVDPRENTVVGTLKTNTQRFRACQCKHCTNGYFGRTAIFEILAMPKKMAELILLQKTSQKMQMAATEGGMLTLWESGLRAVQQGITSIDEIYRILGDEGNKQ